MAKATYIATFAGVDTPQVVSFPTPNGPYLVMPCVPVISSGAASNAWCDTPVDGGGGTSTVNVYVGAAITGTVAVIIAACGPPYSIPVIESLSPPTGLAGQVVTFSGSGFSGAGSVKFDGTSATFTLVSDSELTATVPLTAETGTVSITNPAGTGTGPVFVVIPIAARGAGMVPNGSESSSINVFIRPYYIPSDVTSATLRAANSYASQNGSNLNGGNPIVSNLALYASDGSGNPTGSPLGLWNGSTIPSNGNFFSAPSVPITRGSDGKVVTCMSSPASGTIGYQLSVQHGTVHTGSTSVFPAPTGITDTSPAFWMQLDFETNRPRMILFGDSISVGYNASFEQSAWNRFGAASDWAVDVNAFGGASLAVFITDYVNFKGLWNSKFSTASYMWVQLGVNDIGAGAPNMESYMTTLISDIRASGFTGPIYGNTLAPQDAYSDPSSATRFAYNAWVRSQVGGLFTAVADFAVAQSSGGLASNSDLTVLYAAYDSGDGIHWNVAGHTQALAMIEGLL